MIKNILLLASIAAGSISHASAETSPLIQVDFELSLYSSRTVNSIGPIITATWPAPNLPIASHGNLFLNTTGSTLTHDSDAYPTPEDRMLLSNTSLSIDGLTGTPAFVYPTGSVYWGNQRGGFTATTSYYWESGDGFHRETFGFDFDSPYAEPIASDAAIFTLLTAQRFISSSWNLGKLNIKHERSINGNPFQDEYLYLVRVTGVKSIPEPSTATLTALAFVFGAAIYRKNRTKQIPLA